MSFDFSSIKSLSSISLEENNISQKNEGKKRSRKNSIQNIIKKQKQENNSYQEIYRNETKKLLQSKTTKDNTFTLTSESSLNNKKYNKFINKKIYSEPIEKTSNKQNEENEEDLFIIKKALYNGYINTNYKTKSNINGLSDLKKYIFKKEKRFKDEENNFYQKSISDFMKQLYDLIARISLLIFSYIKLKNLEQAKVIFLLLLKENMKYLNYLEKNIITTYYTSKHFPKESYELLRIYAFIIKYSHFFNMTSNCRIFLGRYLEIIYYIYNWFKNKDNHRVFTIDIKNHINLWFSLALHNVSYFSISYYFPIILPIKLNNIIIDIYSNLDESNLSSLEKSLIIKVFYNLSLSYYLYGQKEKALDILDDARDKILNGEYSAFSQNNNFLKNIKKKLSINFLSTNFNLNDNLSLNNEDDGNRLSTANSFSEYYNVNNKVIKDSDYANKYLEEEKVIETFSKDKINLEDIKLLINYGYKKGLIKERNNGNVNLTNLYSKILVYKKLQIPNYLEHPLLRKIELFMAEIEIDKKNYKLAYEHILKVLYIFCVIKLNEKDKENKQLNQEQRIIEKYLILIEKLKDKGKENNNEQKGENNSEENSLSELNQSLSSNNNKKTNREKYEEELGDIINDKYKLNVLLNKNEIRKTLKKRLLFCGKKEIDLKMLKDMEKFFIFLCSLSLYQIKVLNETQPDSWKRNDLPILFSSQFKDCLSKNQRKELDNLPTMALNRDTILKKPNEFIIPSNLNIYLIKERDMKKIRLRRTNKFINKFCNDNDDNINISKKREFKIYQKIIRLGKLNKDIKEYFNKNLELVLKILKGVEDNDLEKIIESPDIIIEPIKHYIKKRKNHFEKNNIRKRNEINCYSLDKNNPNYRMSTRGFGIFKTKLKLVPNVISISKNEANKIENDQRLSCKKDKRNNSKLGKSFNLQYNEDKPKKIDKRDYNDNYKEIQISIDSSFCCEK